MLLVFYPLDFSPVCSDQLSIYQEVKPELGEQGVEMLGISVDQRLRPQGLPGEARHRHHAARRLRAQGRGRPRLRLLPRQAGFANRTLVLVDEDGKVAWTYESPSPGEFPGANVIFDALAA